MALENTWVTYLNRSYKSIKASILARMQTVVPEITDHSESNVFVVIISSFAGLVEQLNYYIDSLARELYLPTARRYSSLVKISRLIDYRVRAKIGSTVDLKVVSVNGSGEPFNVTSDVTINSGAIVETSSGVEFITTQNRTIIAGTSEVYIPSKQRVLVSNTSLGTTTASSGQVFAIHNDYQHDTLQIVINSLSWALVNTFAFSGPQDRHFIVEVNEAKEAYVVFGDGVNGAIPPTGQIVYGTFYTCGGIEGNVEADTITAWVSGEPTGGGATDFTVTNPESASGGQDEEGIEEIRAHAPLSLRTLDRAVTLQDHIDIALLVPGVGKAAISFNAQLKAITVYVAPAEGGIASSGLLSDVVDYFDDKKMISTAISAEAAGESHILLNLAVTAKFRRSAADTQSDVLSALLLAYGFNNSSVNSSVRKSDIIALIDNLDKVDFLTLNSISHIPYPRITNGTHGLHGVWYINVTTLSIEKAIWRLYIINATTREARLYRYDVADGREYFDRNYNYGLTDPGAADLVSTDGSISLGIWGSFSNGDEWEFTTYPYNQDLVFDDFTVPIIESSDITLAITEQLV